ncbi:J domain-containing protein [Pseudomonas frederiksbergensis]|uniref:Chaperone protein DnaJ n=1 Tax=Pseudomonas frederiksbergensis TaxID=104087 RepID=A0A6L5C2E6_9PSED|nr:J domain-containing protein [Pseudomonas frederiksbergensis]KAF2394332.1 Chaperone protein DnaJ [Pseudomonas frederiksbergensis]
MQNDKSDLKGYYAILGLTPGSGDEHIKAAYRRRAMHLHPDRNPQSDTTQQFQLLNEAYAVLSNPASRADYDQLGSQRETEAPEIPKPIACSRCGKVSAQPRIVVFRSVKSFLVVTVRKPIAGVFCSNCANKQSLKSSAATWLLGWWGFPWGPIYTIQALVTNMFGGSHPPLDNAKMLGYQAYYFYSIGRPELAQSLAESAIKYCKKIPETFARKGAEEVERDDLIRNLETFRTALGIDNKANRLKSSWGLVHSRFFVHLGAIVTVTGVVAISIINSPGSHYAAPRGPMPYSNQSSASPVNGFVVTGQPVVTNATTQKTTPKKASYVRPKTTPNGRPWPVTASYLAGEPQTHAAGHSEVTIDNGKNNSDVQLKLVALEGKVARPARQIFIPAHGRFTIKNLTAGNYDVRYRDLTSGNLSRSELMRLTETSTYKGIQYSVITLTLYKVVNGNTATYGLSEDEF